MNIVGVIETQTHFIGNVWQCGKTRSINPAQILPQGWDPNPPNWRFIIEFATLPAGTSKIQHRLS